MNKLKEIFEEVFKPSNFLITVLTTTVFIILLTLFFWFIISKQLVVILLEKMNILTLFSQKDPNIKMNIVNYMNTFDYEKIKTDASEDELKRYNYNISLLNKEIMPWIYTLISISIIIIFYIIYKITQGNKLDKWEYVLIGLVITAFIPEIILYLVLLNEWKFIGDHKVIQSLTGNSSHN